MPELCLRRLDKELAPERAISEASWSTTYLRAGPLDLPVSGFSPARSQPIRYEGAGPGLARRTLADGLDGIAIVLDGN